MWFDGMLSMPALKSGYDDSAMIQWRKKMFFVQMNVDGKKCTYTITVCRFTFRTMRGVLKRKFQLCGL